jgi:glycolate oxidase iron-sulfur subunit
VKCGLCQSVCPVYATQSGEQNFSRGKISLLRGISEGRLTLDEKAIEALSLCVGCASCQGSCKNEVEYINLLSAARKKINHEKGMPYTKKFALETFSKRGEAENLVTYGSILKKIISAGRGSGKGLELKFPIPGIGKGIYYPPLANESFISRNGGIYKAKNEWARLAFFVGCSSSFILPEIGEAVLNFLIRNGITIIIPEGQVCCGTPHYISGDPDTSNRLLAENETEFARYEFDGVITGCPTCGGGLKEYYNIKDSTGKARPVYDFNEFIAANLDRFEIRHVETDETITWHDPCHLVRLQKIKKQPRKLLKAAVGESFKEMESPDTCCGFGGVFAAAKPKTALAIAKKKAERIEASGAGTVITSCPGCVLFLRMGASLHGGKWNVKHIAQILL